MKYILLSIILVSSILITSCVNEDFNEESTGQVNASITIASRGFDADEDNGNELINKWWLAFVNTSGEVVKIVEKDELGSPVNRDSKTIGVNSGKYTIYAFANIDDKLGFAEGQLLPDGIDLEMWTTVPSIGQLVPMSGKCTVEIKQNTNANFVVEVVRIVAKMRIRVQNATTNDFTVDTITILPALNNKAYLLPDYSSLNNAPVLPADTECTELKRILGKQVSVGDSVIDKFYLLESSAMKHPTEHYIVKMDITRKDDRKYSMSAMTNALQWINRNDYILLPLKIIDYVLDLDVMFYPPIGGYPAVMVEQKSDEYYATFSSSGKFVITPMVKDNTGIILAPNQYTIKSISVEDTNKIFSTTPKLESTGEIIGELASGNKEGKAKVDLEIDVTDTNDITYSFTRTLYIIRQ